MLKICAIKDCSNEAVHPMVSWESKVMFRICQECYDELIPGRVIVIGNDIIIKPFHNFDGVNKRRDDLFREMCVN